MDERIELEMAILRRKYPNARRQDRWVLVPAYPLPADWSAAAVDTAFHVRDGYPGAGLYGIYVPAGLRFKGELPGNYGDTVSPAPPFGGTWGMFSWEAEQWFAKADPAAGHNFLTWVVGFAKRFQEGR